jgi:di/tricarboxylate transporter
MTSEIALLFGIVVIALGLFAWDRFSPDIIALGVLLSLTLTGLVPADKAFAGFGSDTVIMILGLLILTAALQRTGIADLAGRAVLMHAGNDPKRLLLAVMITVASLSAFMSNTAATALFVPVVFGIAKKSGINPGRLLMPLAFSSILSSSVTVISTSTNLVVSGMMTRYDMAPIGMFELAPVGLTIAVVGVLYMYFIGRRMIPERAAPDAQDEDFAARPYLSEIVIQPGSRFDGLTLEEAKIGQTLGLTVIRIIREKTLRLQAHARAVLRVGDVMLVQGSQEDILKVKDTGGMEIKADVKLSDPDLLDSESALAEAIVLPSSRLIGQTLKAYRFSERYDLQVLGINQRGVNVLKKMSLTAIKLGDVLLLQGRRERIAALDGEHAFHILGPLGCMEEVRPRRQRAALAVSIFIAAIVLAAFNVTSLPVAVMLGALLVFATGCITPEEAYGAIEWKAIILIGSMLTLGAAMDHTRAAAYLAGQIIALIGEAGPLWLLSGFFALTVLLTQPMSNQAAAIVVIPIAIQTALQAGLNPRPFAIMIAVAASCSYLTPLEPSCLMVYGPGRYRFADFVKVGSLLTLLIYLIAITLVPWLWPLR